MLVISVLVAHRFLSIIVYQVVPSPLIEISQSVALWNIQAQLAMLLQSYNVVQDDVGTTGVSLNGRTEHPIERYSVAVPIAPTLGDLKYRALLPIPAVEDR
jgi:hypothetical protein